MCQDISSFKFCTRKFQDFVSGQDVSFGEASEGCDLNMVFFSQMEKCWKCAIHATRQHVIWENPMDQHPLALIVSLQVALDTQNSAGKFLLLKFGLETYFTIREKFWTQWFAILPIFFQSVCCQGSLESLHFSDCVKINS